MTKKKTKNIWLRYQVLDTPKAMAEFQLAAKKLFNTRCVESLGQFTDEEIASMVKTALEKARKAHKLNDTKRDTEDMIP